MHINSPKLSIEMSDNLSISPTLKIPSFNEIQSCSYSSLHSTPHNIIRVESLEEMAEIVQSHDISFNSISNSAFAVIENESVDILAPSAEEIDKSLSGLLQEIENIIQEKVPDRLVVWCQKILGNENYILRYQSNYSEMSEESRSNIDEMSIVSEANSQEINYKTHIKLSQQKKTIDSLMNRLREKKERIRVSKLHIKTLQNEIRNLDDKIKKESSLDLEYLKTTVMNLSKKLVKLDKDSMIMLQIIFSQLGLSFDETHSQEEKKRWGVFSRK